MYPEPLKPIVGTIDSKSKSNNPAIYLPVMPKITVWGDLTLDILIAKMIEDEKKET